MTSIHRRNYSEPIPGYIYCESCTGYFKKAQQHFDHSYDKTRLCSWNCVISIDNEIENRLKGAAKKFAKEFFEEKKADDR